MKKKNIISLILSLLVMFNMAFCVSAIGLQHDDTDSVYGTSDLSSESVGSLSEDTDALNQVIDENPIEELEKFLSETTKGNDDIKARRIIERIKFLTLEDKLISENKRK